MIKKINISEEVVARLVKSNKCVEGSLSFDRETGKITFKAYNRQYRSGEPREVTIKNLEFGRIAESRQRIKVYESIPKKIGTQRICSVLERETKEAQIALIDLDIINLN
jgi:hypothetical protein